MIPPQASSHTSVFPACQYGSTGVYLTLIHSPPVGYILIIMYDYVLWLVCFFTLCKAFLTFLALNVYFSLLYRQEVHTAVWWPRSLRPAVRVVHTLLHVMFELCKAAKSLCFSSGSQVKGIITQNNINCTYTHLPLLSMVPEKVFGRMVLRRAEHTTAFFFH